MTLLVASVGELDFTERMQRKKQRKSQGRAIDEYTAPQRETRKMATASEVAKVLNVSPRTVLYWAEAGEIPHYRAGKTPRFDIEKVLKSIQK